MKNLEEVTARSFSEIMKEEANKLAGKTKEEALKIKKLNNWNIEGRN